MPSAMPRMIASTNAVVTSCRVDAVACGSRAVTFCPVKVEPRSQPPATGTMHRATPPSQIPQRKGGGTSRCCAWTRASISACRFGELLPCRSSSGSPEDDASTYMMNDAAIRIRIETITRLAMKLTMGIGTCSREASEVPRAGPRDDRTSDGAPFLDRGIDAPR